MARPKKVQEAEPVPTETPTEATAEQKSASQELAAAIVEAIRSTQPEPTFAKKTIFNKKSKTPWNPTGGSRPRLKRKAYHHGMMIGDPTEPTCRLTNTEIVLFNQLKPGTYCNGYVKVSRRRDKGIDVDYPIRTNSQRLRLVNDFGIRSFEELLQRCVTEAATPKPVESDLDDE